MPRFYIRLALFPLVLLSITLLLNRAQPHDDHELRQLLFPEGCPAPCFMGIRPGVTTMEEAVNLLEASGWVGQMEKVSIGFDDTTIKWTWNSQIPKGIIPSSQGQIRGAQNSEKLLVRGVTIYSFLQLGDVFAVLGSPDTEVLDFTGYSIGERYAYIDYWAFYKTQNLFLSFGQACRTGYPQAGASEKPGVPFTTLVSIQLDGQFTIPAGIAPVSSRIHAFPSCRQ